MSLLVVVIVHFQTLKTLKCGFSSRIQWRKSVNARYELGAVAAKSLAVVWRIDGGSSNRIEVECLKPIKSELQSRALPPHIIKSTPAWWWWKCLEFTLKTPRGIITVSTSQLSGPPKTRSSPTIYNEIHLHVFSEDVGIDVNVTFFFFFFKLELLPCSATGWNISTSSQRNFAC